MSVTTLVTCKSFAHQLILRSLQRPFRKVYNEAFCGQSFRAILHAPGVSNINSTSVYSRFSFICRELLQKIVRLPINKRLKRSSLLQKRSVILLTAAGSFLGYHKDGKVFKTYFGVLQKFLFIYYCPLFI